MKKVILVKLAEIEICFILSTDQIFSDKKP